MSKKNKVPKQLSVNLLRSVVEFMVRAGISEKEVKAAFADSLRRARLLSIELPSAPETRNARPVEDVAAHALRCWFRDARYLDNHEFEPKPLHLEKGRNSIRSLIRNLDSEVDASEVVRAMKSAGLIRRTRQGKYLPTTSAVILPSMHPWTVEHTVNSVMRLLDTVYRNATLDEGAKPLLERYSYVPDLDPADSQQFVEFARSQGQVLLDVIDDWLEQRRVRKAPVTERRKRGVSAGIHLITFVGLDSKPVASRSNASGLSKAGASKKAGVPDGKKALLATPLPSTPA